MAIIVIDIHIH